MSGMSVLSTFPITSYRTDHMHLTYYPTYYTPPTLPSTRMLPYDYSQAWHVYSSSR